LLSILIESSHQGERSDSFITAVVCTRPCKLLHLDVLEVLHSFFKCACVTIVDVTLTQELLDSQSGFGVATKLLQQLRHPVNQDAACTGLIELGESLLDTFDLILVVPDLAFVRH